MKSPLGFALTTLCVSLLGAAVMAQLFGEPRAGRAVWVSALLALLVQLASYAIARRYARQGNVMKGWGIGALLRVGALGLYGLLAPRLLAFPIAPALVSFAVIVFVTTVIEPLFLAA